MNTDKLLSVSTIYPDKYPSCEQGLNKECFRPETEKADSYMRDVTVSTSRTELGTLP